MASKFSKFKNRIIKSTEYEYDMTTDADQTTGTTVHHKEDRQQWKIPNPLHKFATYNVLFTLSALTEKEIRKPDEYLHKKQHDIIARSGGIGDKNQFSDAMDKIRGGTVYDPHHIRRDYEASIPKDIKDSVKILQRNRDIFFENVNILSTVAPNESRNSMNFTKIEFELHEPYGVTFVEKVRAAAFNSGFLDYQDAPFLLTIEWKGWDEHSRPIKTEDSLIRKIPILLSRVEFTVNEGGTVYTVIAVPYNDFAMMDRYNLPRSDTTVKATDLTRHQGKGDASRDSNYWDEQVIAILNKQMKDEAVEGLRVYPDEYEITFDPEILKQGHTESRKAVGYESGLKRKSLPGKANTFRKEDITFVASSTKISPGIHLSKSIEDAVRSLPFYKELTTNFWETYLKKVVKTETFSGPGNLSSTINDVGAKDYKKWLDPENSKKLASVMAMNQTVPWFKVISSVHTESRLDDITKMHPKKIKFHVVPYYIHILKLARAGISFGNVDWGKYVRKHFNYIYTGENVDVQNLRIDYKVGYWQKNVRSASPETVLAKFKKKFGSYTKLFGEDMDRAILNLRQYPSLEKSDGVTGSESNVGPALDQFWDYLTNPQADMMRIELEILGDPAFLSQDMYTTLSTGNETNSARGDGTQDYNDFYNCYNIDSVLPIIGVNYRMPGDIDIQDGLMFNSGELESNIFFNGVYQVNKVESRINNGQFTQILYCTRLNNQTGAGGPPTKAQINIFQDYQKHTNKKVSHHDDSPGVLSGDAETGVVY